MKSDGGLESLVFQLTPTRTRCDLVITCNGKMEKIASGLFNPFLAHLKTAQDQIAKGGYSIKLQPDHGANTPWFTKDTVERFVRFVSTPEVLERVNTIELEILQIEEAIAIQGKECIGLDIVEDHQTRPVFIEGSRTTGETDSEKAIVLYKPGAHEPESNGSTVKAENSKVQLLRVLETRKTVLQKEQGMAFARAAAAGFDMNQMAHLISFAECFGASRLLMACMKFMELWKEKHETGQWIEIEAAEAMSMRSDFSSVNASGIFLSGDTRRHSDTSNVKLNGDAGAEYLDSDPNRGRTSGEPQVPLGSHEYLQGQFQHPVFPQWPMYSSPGAPVFQPYPMQGMPYYQNYPGSGPFFQPPYSPMEDPRYNSHKKVKTKRNSVDGKDSNDESEMCVSSKRSQDDMDQDTSELDKEVSEGRGSRRNGGLSGKNQSGVVVIRNINYIMSKGHNASGSESESASYSETEEESEDLHNEAPERRRKKSSGSSKNKGKTKSVEASNSLEDKTRVQAAGSENWQAFQSFLLRDEDNSRSTAADEGLFSGEKLPPMNRRRSNTIADPMLPPDRSTGDVLEQRAIEFDTVSGRTILRKKTMASDDDLAYPNDGRTKRESTLDVEFQEMELGVGGYRRGPSDDFMIYGQGKQSTSRGSLDPLTETMYKLGGSFGEESQPDITDESFIVPSRSFSQEQVGPDSRAAINMNLDFPPALHEKEKSSLQNRYQASYEPDDLSLMPDRTAEGECIGHDRAIDYAMEAHVNNNVSGIQEDIPASPKEGLKKSDKEKKSRTLQDGLEKRKLDALRRGKPSRLNPLAEAQARAEKLRAYKADLQKEKKEKEEQERKRLEALKRERQKRIAAKGTSSVVQTLSTPPQNRAQVPAKLSPSSHSSSKFSDSGPGSSSSLHKFPRRTYVGSTDSQKTKKNSRLYGNHSAGNSLSRSVSSLPEAKKENNDLVPEQKTISTPKRLSDPIGGVARRASSLKSASSGQLSKQNISGPKSTTVPRASSVMSESRNSELKHVSDEPQIKKISAIVNLDKSKSATLPELKIRIPTGTPSTVKNNPTAKEAAHKANVSKSSLISKDMKKKKITENTTQQLSDGDGILVEKNIVIQEKEAVSVPLAASSESDKGDNTEIVPEYAAIQAPPLTMVSSGVVKVAKEKVLDEQITYEVTIDCVKDESQNFSSSITTEKPYQAPLARASSLEDSSTISFNQSEALPITSSVMAKAVSQNIQTEISTFGNPIAVEPEYEKPRVKESSKGFKRLLKFGRKSSAFEERNVVSDCSSVDDHAASALSPSEATTLKSLLSEDDPHAEGTSKASRSFSILSPFRGKTSEKKIIV